MSTAAYLLFAAITASAVLVIVRLVRRDKLRAKYSLLWLSVGLGLVLLLAIPGSIDYVSLKLGIYYPPALYLSLAVALLFFVVVHLSYELSRLESHTRTMAEELALLALEVKKCQSLIDTTGDVATSKETSGHQR